VASSVTPDPTGFNALFAALDAAQSAALAAQQDAAGANSSIGTTNAQLDAALGLLTELGWPVSVQIRDPYILSNVTMTLSPTSGSIANSAASVTLTAVVKNSVTGAVLNFPVTWTSDAPQGLSLTPSGATCVVKGTQSGIVGHVTASAGPVTASATITTAAQQVTALALAPSSLSLTTTAAQNIQALATDPFGAVVPAASVAWSNSESPGGCYAFTGFQIPTAHATVQAVANGSGTVQATANGINATCAIAVNLPSMTGAVPGTNMPAAMTVVVNTGKMNVNPANGSQNGGAPGGTWTVTGPTGIVTTFSMFSPDAISPQGEWSGNVQLPAGGATGLQINYLPSLPGGGSPVRFGINWPATGGTGKLYAAWLMQFNPGWSFSQALGIKLFEPRGTPSENHVFAVTCASNPSDGVSAYPQFLLQGVQTGDLPGGGSSSGVPPSFTAQSTVFGAQAALANLGGPNIGTTHLIEWLIIPESPVGSGGNGQLTIWIDGTIVWTSVGKGTTGITYGVNNYTSLTCDATYGGDSASDHPPGCSWKFDQMWIAVA
jgi:hypothetical protein